MWEQVSFIKIWELSLRNTDIYIYYLFYAKDGSNKFKLSFIKKYNRNFKYLKKVSQGLNRYKPSF